MKKIGLDLGGSGVRGRNANGIIKMESQHTEVDVNARVFETITDKQSDILVVQSPFAAIEGRRYVRGEARDYHNGSKSQVDNQTLKVDQESTYVNAAHMLAVHAERLSLEGQSDISFAVGVTIPTSEFYSEAADRVKTQLSGNYTVTFQLTGKTVSFKVLDVKVLPEGVAALLAMVKSNYGTTIREKIGIIIDAGRRSTDITIINQLKPHAQSARSLPIGGITLEALVSSELEKGGFLVSDRTVSEAIATGKIPNGSAVMDVGMYVERAKANLATEIYSRLRSIFAAAGMAFTEISYVMYLGRCFSVTTKEEKDPKYTGDLGKLILQEIGTPMVRIDVENLETANVDAAYNAICRVVHAS